MTSDLDRITASATYYRSVDDRLWATTVAAGWNREAHHRSAAFLAETAADLTRRDTAFGRAEIVTKTAADLVLPEADHDASFTIGKLTGGYTRWFESGGPITLGLGGSAGWAVLPASLEPHYGGRLVGEFSVFVTLRPQE